MTDDPFAQIRYPYPIPAFTPVPPEARRLIRNLPANKATLHWAEGMVEALRELELHNPSFSAPPPPTIRLAAWNLHQCQYPRAAAKVLAKEGVDIALLSEMDIGLTRSGQHHTLALVSEMVAQSTGIPRGYGAGVEFYETWTTDSTTTASGRLVENWAGFHANGWLTRFKARRPILLRLMPEADWFVVPHPDQRRVGGRLGVGAIFELGKVELVAVSVHLESDTDAAGRRRQMAQLLDGLDEFAGRRPIVIGGDFSTDIPEPHPDAHGEDLFIEAERHGYIWRPANTRDQTFHPERTANPAGRNAARHDWFFVKGLAVREPGVIPAVDEDGKTISDHDAVTISLVLPQVF